MFATVLACAVRNKRSADNNRDCGVVLAYELDDLNYRYVDYVERGRNGYATGVLCQTGRQFIFFLLEKIDVVRAKTPLP